MKHIRSPFIFLMAAGAITLLGFISMKYEFHTNTPDPQTRMSLALPGLLKYVSTLDLPAMCETTLNLYIQAGIIKIRAPDEDTAYLASGSMEALGTRYINSGCRIKGILIVNFLLREHGGVRL